MDTKLYSVEFAVTLVPHGSINPVITYGLEQAITTVELAQPVTLTFDLSLGKGPAIFFIEFYNKTDDTPDMAVEIQSVTFEGMTLDRFKWNNRYYPRYPQPWASQQTDPLPEYQSSATYMGWNGRWELYFDIPIFTWIHQIEALGWIYAPDPNSDGIKRIE
jgi:hypothetical protein